MIFLFNIKTWKIWFYCKIKTWKITADGFEIVALLLSDKMSHVLV